MSVSNSLFETSTSFFTVRGRQNLLDLAGDLKLRPLGRGANTLTLCYPSNKFDDVKQS